MTDLREPSTRNSQPSEKPMGGPANSTDPADSADPLHNLYRMSRTAGLGSGDYVAINNGSILALMLGLFGVLSLLYPLLLIVSLAAVISGVMALIQIRSSNGTQSGRGFAVLGVLLGLGLGGLSGGQLLMSGLETHREESALDALVHRLSDLLVAGKYAEAYQTCFTDQFKTQFTEQEFAGRWQATTGYYGGVQSMDWGKHAEIQAVRGTDIKRAAASSVLKFIKANDTANQGIFFLKQNGEWRIDLIQQLFEKETKGRNAQPDPRTPQGPTFQLPGSPGAPAAPAGPVPPIPTN